MLYTNSPERARSLIVVPVAIRGILLVLVLSDQVPDVLVRLLELHLVHALALVPVEEGLALVEGAELRREALEHGLERGGVGHEGGGDVGINRRYIDDGALDVVGDPLDEVLGLGGLDLLDVLVGLLRGDLATVVHGGGQELAILDGDVGVELLAGPACLVSSWMNSLV